MLSPFLVSPPPLPIPSLLPCSPTHQLLLPGPDIPLHWGIQPSQNQRHLLALMTDKATWVLPCVLFGWWFSPWELWRFWVVHIVVPPIGLQTPSAPRVLWGCGYGGKRGGVQPEFWCSGLADARGLWQDFHAAPGGCLAVWSHWPHSAGGRQGAVLGTRFPASSIPDWIP